MYALTRIHWPTDQTNHIHFQCVMRRDRPFWSERSQNGRPSPRCIVLNRREDVCHKRAFIAVRHRWSPVKRAGCRMPHISAYSFTTVSCDWSQNGVIGHIKTRRSIASLNSQKKRVGMLVRVRREVNPWSETRKLRGLSPFAGKALTARL